NRTKQRIGDGCFCDSKLLLLNFSENRGILRWSRKHHRRRSWAKSAPKKALPISSLTQEVLTNWLTFVGGDRTHFPFVILGRSKERSDAAQTPGSMP
ncbi:MAG: hypothetical protein E5X89_33445, partial [Mesorhizobium sp.]